MQHEDVHEWVSVCMLKVTFNDFININGRRHIIVSIYDNEGYGCYERVFTYAPTARLHYDRTVQVLKDFRKKLVEIGWDISKPSNENFEDIDD